MPHGYWIARAILPNPLGPSKRRMRRRPTPVFLADYPPESLRVSEGPSSSMTISVFPSGILRLYRCWSAPIGLDGRAPPPKAKRSLGLPKSHDADKSAVSFLSFGSPVPQIFAYAKTGLGACPFGFFKPPPSSLLLTKIAAHEVGCPCCRLFSRSENFPAIPENDMGKAEGPRLLPPVQGGRRGMRGEQRAQYGEDGGGRKHAVTPACRPPAECRD